MVQRNERVKLAASFWNNVGAGMVIGGMLPQSYPNYKTVHRRFQTWCRDEVLRRVLTDVANELRDRGALDEEECFIDATFVMAKDGRLETSPGFNGSAGSSFAGSTTPTTSSALFQLACLVILFKRF